LRLMAPGSHCKFQTGPRGGVGEMEDHRERSVRGRWGDGRRVRNESLARQLRTAS